MVKIDSLVINITDICNMACDFCLRGDAGKDKIDLSLIPKIFEGIDEIGGITLTGGEPGCNIEAVTAIVDYLVEHKDDIHVKGFFMVTNGKEYHQELVDAVKTMMLLYIESDFAKTSNISGEDVKGYNALVEEEFYMFGLAVSMDDFHEPIPLTNWLKYRTSGVYSPVKEQNYQKTGIIARGKGAGFPNSYKKRYEELFVEEEDGGITADRVYITVEGNVFADCDMSYEMETWHEPYGDLTEETLVQILKKNVED